MKALLTIIGVGIIALLVVFTTFFKVDESEYALVLRFGEIINVYHNPGLGVKMPIIDSTQRIDKRTLRADIPPREVPDRDRERLVMDTVVRYEITDPVAFRIALRNEATALNRIQTIMYSAMRDTAATRDRTEIIGARPVLDAEGNLVNNDDGLPVYERLADTRDEITEEFRARVEHAAVTQNYGIRIISANIKRADFPTQVENSILDKLRSERYRVAAAHRAHGQEEYLQRTSAAQAEADILLAEARRDARRITGEGEAKAIAIIREALQEDPEFYRFLRKIESYAATLTPGSLIVFDSDNDSYLDLLVNGPPNGQ